MNAALLTIISSLLEEEHTEEVYSKVQDEVEDDMLFNMSQQNISSVQLFENLPNFHSRPNLYAEVWIDRYSEEDFRRIFRLTPTTFELLVEALCSVAHYRPPEWTRGKEPLDLNKKTYVGLVYMASKATLLQISNQFNICESTTLKAVDSFCKTLEELRSKFIKWPSEAEGNEIVEEFYRLANFPGVIGAVDGTHILAKFAANIKHDYINRKCQKTINLTAVCSPNKLFIDICVGAPGRMHDSRVLLMHSGLVKTINTRGPLSITYTEEHHIIGDSAYSLKPWLMVPYKGPSSQAERIYNYKLSSSRVVIENAFSLLKGRWKRLHYVDVNTIDKLCARITAACVLHNFCILQDDILENIIVAEEHEEHHLPNPNYVESLSNDVQYQLGVQKRNEIRDMLLPQGR